MRMPRAQTICVLRISFLAVAYGLPVKAIVSMVYCEFVFMTLFPRVVRA